MTREQHIRDLQRQSQEALRKRQWRRFHKINGELAPLIRKQLRAEIRQEKRKAA